MKHRYLALILAAVVSTSAFSTPVQSFIGASVTADAATAPATPTANLKGGSYYCKSGYYISLKCATKGAKIYYSLNGADYKLYTAKIPVTKNATLKFYAKANGASSKVVSYSYKFFPKVTASLKSGTYSGTQTIKLSSESKNVKFYYTLDGSTPTTKSKLYTSAGITIDESCTLRVYPYKSGWSKKIHDFTYKITDPADFTENLLDKYTSKYAYSTLTTTQKKIYADLYKCVANYSTKIDVSKYNCTADDVNKAFYAMDYDNPQFFWLASGYSYSYTSAKILTVTPKYARSKTDMTKIKPKLEAAAQKIIDEALEIDDLFERVVYLHDAITHNTDYTSAGGEYKRDADGPLLNGKALCEGYSKAFAYLCQSVGIECICVEGSSEGDHMWNMIKLEDKWYHIDVTFDDPVGYGAEPGYDYFCVTSKKILSTHELDNPFKVPAATATKYNYYEVMDIPMFETSDEAFEALIKLSTENYDKGIMTTEIYFNSGSAKAFFGYFGLNQMKYVDILEEMGCTANGIETYGYKGAMFYLTLR